jgi:phytanoyl-CoA hydroxylase
MTAAGFAPEERNAFRRDGFYVARGVGSAALCARLREVTLAHLRDRVEPIEYEADLHYPGAPASRYAPGGQTARRLLQACARHPAYGRLPTRWPRGCGTCWGRGWGWRRCITTA